MGDLTATGNNKVKAIVIDYKGDWIDDKERYECPECKRGLIGWHFMELKDCLGVKRLVSECPYCKARFYGYPPIARGIFL